MQAIRRSVLHIAKNALDNIPVSTTRCMKKLAHLIDRKR
jgi:hypothetical protein